LTLLSVFFFLACDDMADDAIKEETDCDEWRPSDVLNNGGFRCVWD